MPTALQNFAFKISLQCCDIFKKRESDIFQCFDHLEPREPAQEEVDLLSQKPSSREQTNKEFLVRAYTDWIIKKYAAGLNLDKFHVVNSARYAFTEKTEELKNVLQYSVRGGAVAVSKQLLRQTLLCRTIARTADEETDIPVIQTRVWPASYLKNLQEFNIIKDKNHPVRLMHFTYGLIRDFIYSTYNYSRVFEKGSGELVIDAITRESRFNGERIDHELQVASKMYKHFYHSGVTNDIDEISHLFDQRPDEGNQRLIQDNIHAAELTARVEARTVDTPVGDTRVISRLAKTHANAINERSIQQTIEILAVVRTETDEYRVPFTQIRLWPANLVLEH